MSEKLSKKSPEILKWYRNLNLIGAVALAACGIYYPAYQEAFFAGAGLDVAQAGAAEVLRRTRKRKKASAAA